MLVGLSAPEAWPPEFGTLRGFGGKSILVGPVDVDYSILVPQVSSSDPADTPITDPMTRTFWHQYYRSTLEGLSGAMPHDILCLPHSGLVIRHTKRFFVFFFSVCMHIAFDVGAAVEVRHGAIKFCYTQVLSIIIENTVQAQWSHIQISQQGGYCKAANWKRWVGHIWVLMFVVWSTPVFQYPAPPAMTSKRPVGDEMLPFNVARILFF